MIRLEESGRQRDGTRWRARNPRSALRAGEHPKLVSEMLGHARIGLTLDTYSHLIPGIEGRAAQRLEDVIQGAAKAGQVSA